MAKEFNKKFMHPTRRKLVDMVLTGGEYQKEAFVSFAGADKEIIKRKVGEKWTDEDGRSWEQTEGGRIEFSELGDIMAETRAYLAALNSCKGDSCNTIKLSRADKKLISKTGYCATCLAKKELVIKLDGLWEAYEDYKMYNNMIAYGKDVVFQFQQAYNDAKQTYEVVNEDGTIEKWSMERNVDELKAEILTDITRFEEEIQQATKLRNDAWDKLKDKGYDLVKPPID
jgi:hypothetical protein